MKTQYFCYIIDLEQNWIILSTGNGRRHEVRKINESLKNKMLKQIEPMSMNWWMKLKINLHKKRAQRKKKKENYNFMECSRNKNILL